MSISYVPRNKHVRDGEITLKDFVHSEAEKYGITESAIYNRVLRGTYHGLEFRRVNKRVVFVKEKTRPMPTTT